MIEAPIGFDDRSRDGRRQIGVDPIFRTHAPHHAAGSPVRCNDTVASTFDTLYHATAMHTEGATLITADDSCDDKARHRRRITRLKDL